MKNYLRMTAPGMMAASICFLAGCLNDSGETANRDANDLKAAAASAPTLHPLGVKRDSRALMASKIIHMGAAAKAAALPASVDFSNLAPPVGNQGIQGSCVGWAASNVKSIQEAQEEGWNVTSPLHRVSPASIYNLINGGVDGGSYPSDAFNLLSGSGADAEYFFPYDQFDFTKQRDFYSNRRSNRSVDNGWASFGTSVADIKNALAQKQPVLFSIAVYPDFDNVSTANPIYDNTVGALRGYHAITAVGYDDAKQAFKILNSWGPYWGINGYGWLSYNLLSDPNLAFDSYVLYNGTNARGWYQGYHARDVGDVNGDGKKDFIAMGSDGVQVSLSNGTSLGSPSFWNTSVKLRTLSYNAYVPDRRIGDVNGDGKADIVSFGDGVAASSDPVLVSLSNGSSFADPATWLAAGFCHQASYVSGFSRQVADMNADGKADLVGYCMDGVYVSISTGSAFKAPVKWTSSFSYGNGFDTQFTRLVADVNGDKKGDFVVFGDWGVWLVLGTGTGVGASLTGTNEFGWTSGWDANTVKELADVNGDGKADIVAYGYTSVKTALSTGNAFAASKVWTNNYGFNNGYAGNAVKLAADMSGDKKADLVLTNFTDVHVATSSGTAFGADGLWLKKCFGSNSHEWFQP